MGNPNHYEILEFITNWPEGKHFGLPSEEEEDWVSCTEEAPPHNQAPESERRHTLFTESSCHVIGTSKKLKAAILKSKQQLPKLPKEKASRTLLQDNWSKKRQTDHSQVHGSKMTAPKVTNPKLHPGMLGQFLAQWDNFPLPQWGSNLTQPLTPAESG
ncbi:hypothetical protein TURU_006186 [Turdus rufiventris]|nr:hypothetical protein TURU_006186 [Turdus rufiventris]